MVTARHRGNDIEFANNTWIYSDTKEPVPNNYKDRPCGYCGKAFTKEGHDCCLGTLQGLMNACCGHGKTEEAYVQFWDESCIRGEDAKIIIEVLKRNRDKCTKHIKKTKARPLSKPKLAPKTDFPWTVSRTL